MKRSIVFLCVFLIASGAVMAATDPQLALTGEEIEPGTLIYFPLIARSIPKSASQEFGLNFISAPGSPADEERYQSAMASGATWNRWPIYWYGVETSPGVFEWSQADEVLAADQSHGFQTEVILMGTPGIYATGGRAEIEPPQVGKRPLDWMVARSAETPSSTASTVPMGLYDPIFTDGSDVPGFGKQINSANKWARFVYETVKHLSPRGVTHYEIWNEQDYSFFWNGTPEEYARLLKVAYLASQQADDGAQVIFGGLANFEKPDFLINVLKVFKKDSMANSYDWFFDILATHSYSYAWDSYYHVFRADNTLKEYSGVKPIWLNESGVPVWNDYPGPTWDPDSWFRSTMEEQSSYIIQSAMYSLFTGATVVFHFQLYDDCGNQPAGTDFPPNDGSICNGDSNNCAGDAFGLFRNPSDGPCFTQHPQPGTARPSFDAYRVLTEHLWGLEPYWRKRPDGKFVDSQEWIAFYRPATGERVLGIWSRFGSTETAKVPAVDSSATLVYPDGSTSIIFPVNGEYRLNLEPATNQNTPYLKYDDLYAIGGPPLILIEDESRAADGFGKTPTKIQRLEDLKSQ